MQQDHWFPTNEGGELELSSTLKPLESVKHQLQVIGGLKHENATAGNDGAGDHARANATFLTGRRARKTAGKDIHVGVSVDQVAAQRAEVATRFSSLELSSDAVRNSGSCDSGYACAYQYNLSWSSASTPVTPEPNPRLVFERLFGTGIHGERQKNFELRQNSNRSVLDFVLDDARDLQKKLGADDRHKLDEYVSSVRRVEEGIRSTEKFGSVPDPKQQTPMGIPSDFGKHIEINFDLMLLAFQTDSTRIATLLIAYDGSNRTFPDLGISEGHHYLTHNQRVPELAEKVAAIDRFYVERFAAFLKKMDSIQTIVRKCRMDFIYEQEDMLVEQIEMYDNAGRHVQTMKFADYKDINGIKMPQKWQQTYLYEQSYYSRSPFRISLDVDYDPEISR